MSEMAKQYDPSEVEPRWQAWWMDNGCFAAADTSDKPQHSISMPPPNVTGSLHMGHALTATLQDILTRWRRMSGYNALWLPGTDHAGIATQMVVERELAKEGITRFDLGREKFLEKVWEWKEKCHTRISEQHYKLGVSCDWERERFTMDEGLSRAVNEVFVQLYDEGLIYRSERLVNWCPKMHTVLSDLEVESEEEDGHLWHFAYPVKGSDVTLVVATTRPETMLGDTAVAVHPEDKRYKHLIGQVVVLPLTGREIPIVGDDILVDMEFGTGCVKVTPAHDFNDFETGKRHDLELINIFDVNACCNDAVPEQYRGLERYEARKRVIADLDALGLLQKVEDHKMSIGRSQRSGEVVEPRLSKQWFVRADVLAKEAIRVVEEGEIKIVPEHWTKTYYHWMYNIRDWCISRQLWWGHRIPAWYCSDCEGVTVSRTDVKACQACGSANLDQDEDVLDTWFSSGLWPFSTLGWPDKTPSLKTFYPNSVMETGHDILFFWVARMIMLGCKFMGGVPFKTVYLHAMVRDENGDKMSKTKGNVVDPLEIVETHGADALRFTLAALTVAGRSIKLAEDRLDGYRNFGNKVWNASRYTQMRLEDWKPGSPAGELNPADKWILTRLSEATAKTNEQLEAFDFGAAASTVYQFFWHELCDWYIELSKVALDGDGKAAAQHTLRHVLDGALRLLHPFMPHLTEEIWQRLPREEGDPSALMLAPFALDGLQSFPVEAERFDVVLAVISAVRNIRGENGIAPSAPIAVTVKADGAKAEALEAGRPYLARLARVETLTIDASATAPEGSAVTRAAGLDIIVPLEGLVDFDAERARLQKVIGKLEEDMGKTNKKLGNPNFVERAKPEAVEKERAKLAKFQAQHATATAALHRLP